MELQNFQRSIITLGSVKESFVTEALIFFWLMKWQNQQLIISDKIINLGKKEFSLIQRVKYYCENRFIRHE